MSLWALDTSVLVASLLRRHPAHHRCLAVWQRSAEAGMQLAICAHALAETFSVLTRLPLAPPLAPASPSAGAVVWCRIPCMWSAPATRGQRCCGP